MQLSTLSAVLQGEKGRGTDEGLVTDSPTEAVRPPCNPLSDLPSLQDSSDDENLSPFLGCIPSFRQSRSPREQFSSTPGAYSNTTSYSHVYSGLEMPIGTI